MKKYQFVATIRFCFLISTLMLASAFAEANTSAVENEILITDTQSCARALLENSTKPASVVVPLLDKCLTLPELGISVQAILFRMRGDSYTKLKKWPLAIAD